MFDASTHKCNIIKLCCRIVHAISPADEGIDGMLLHMNLYISQALSRRLAQPPKLNLKTGTMKREGKGETFEDVYAGTSGEGFNAALLS